MWFMAFLLISVIFVVSGFVREQKEMRRWLELERDKDMARSNRNRMWVLYLIIPILVLIISYGTIR